MAYPENETDFISYITNAFISLIINSIKQRSVKKTHDLYTRRDTDFISYITNAFISLSINSIKQRSVKEICIIKSNPLNRHGYII